MLTFCPGQTVLFQAPARPEVIQRHSSQTHLVISGLVNDSVVDEESPFFRGVFNSPES